MSGMNINAYLYKNPLTYQCKSAPYQCLAQSWFVQSSRPVYYPRYRCSIEPLICGEDVFRQVARDVANARDSVDIITWGFDPGMVLVRGATAEDGMRYGDLLKQIATRKKNPVKVRLLVWHDDIAAHLQMKNNPGFYGTMFPSIDGLVTSYYSETHQAYNAQWYAQVCAGDIPNIHFHVREVPSKFISPALQDETSPSNPMAALTTMYISHHQKMLLIDYEVPKLAIGYVMGHNSITDFWDTKEHKYRDRRRERFYKMDHATLQNKAWSQGQGFDAFHYRMTESQESNKERAVQSYLDAHSYVSKPYQDVSCRVRGPILYDLNHNFCQAWEESTPPSPLFAELCWLIQIPTLLEPLKVVKKIQHYFHDEMDPQFIARRKKLSLGAFDLPGGKHSLQLLRTQPLHGEKVIKECYANLTRQMLHYMFIQNQYIQYAPWASHLIECVRHLRAAGYLKPVYIFILTSTPENDGMDLPTYDVASVLGLSETMRYQHEESLKKARALKAPKKITPQELSVQGIEVFMGSLWTCAEVERKLQPWEYEEIYIHSKVAVVDDAAFTIGSANLNLRSMALDSELNVLSDAFDVAYQLRGDLFRQCTKDSGPVAFDNMGETFKKWKQIAEKNRDLMAEGELLLSQILPFYVDREPGSPVV